MCEGKIKDGMEKDFSLISSAFSISRPRKPSPMHVIIELSRSPKPKQKKDEISKLKEIYENHIQEDDKGAKGS